MKAPDASRTFSFFENLSFQVNAFAASAILLICLIFLGAIAYVTLNKSEDDLHTLSSTILPKQSAFALVSDNIVAIQMKIFRYVSWASNSVSGVLLGALNAEIASDLIRANLDLENLAKRPDLSAREQKDLKDLISKWKRFDSSVRDTIEIGSSDAAMATMMLGQTDDKFTALSALSELDSVVRCIEAGADDHLAKPFDPVLLRARVGSSLEKKHRRDRKRKMVEALWIEKERSENLLLNILPKAIVRRLHDGEVVIADQLSNVTILFSDLVGFTKLSSRLSPSDLVGLLNGLFSEFDRLALNRGVEKIKTIGDAYMVVGGLPEPRADHAHAVADMALAMIEAVELINRDLPAPLQMRIGIHSGDVVAGVIGPHKFAYNIWGDTVNVASRMKSHSLPSRIQISAATYQHLHKHFLLEPHGSVDIEGKGPMETYFLIARTAEGIE